MGAMQHISEPIMLRCHQLNGEQCIVNAMPDWNISQVMDAIHGLIALSTGEFSLVADTQVLHRRQYVRDLALDMNRELTIVRKRRERKFTDVLKQLPTEEKDNDPLLGARIKRIRSTVCDGKLHSGQVVDVQIGERTGIKQYRIRYQDGGFGWLREAAVKAVQVTDSGILTPSAEDDAEDASNRSKR